MYSQGALWHIFPAHSAEKIRRFLKKVKIISIFRGYEFCCQTFLFLIIPCFFQVAEERNMGLGDVFDPIHDQVFIFDPDFIMKFQLFSKPCSHYV